MCHVCVDVYEAPSNSAEAAAEPQDMNKGLLELLGDLREPQCPVMSGIQTPPPCLPPAAV